MIHIDVITNEFNCKAIIKIEGNVVNNCYYSRSIVKVVPSPAQNNILLVFPENNCYEVTHNQDSLEEKVYIVDTVDGEVPSSLADLAEKLSSIIRF